MKNVTVNIQIQFDVTEDTEEKIREEVERVLNQFNSELQRSHDDISPLIFTNSLDSSDIEIHTPEDEEEDFDYSMCKKYPDAQAIPDEEGKCILCGGDCV